MDIYPIETRENRIPRIGVKDLVTAVFLMASRAREAGCNIMFFPKAGGLPLKYIYENSDVGMHDPMIKIFSSKVTASSKSALSKQICGILTPAERKKHLTRKQIHDFSETITKLPLVSRKKILKLIDVGNLDQLNICEIITAICDIGLYVPSEDKYNWVKAGIIPEAAYLPENGSYSEFQNFKKEMIAYSLEQMPAIVHDSRPLLNIVLSTTNFAKSVSNNKVYVMDEAISRGRTLNVLEIIFKAFNKDVIWKIGVLFCPLKVVGQGNIDFVLSQKNIPPFSNRFDLIGEIVVESDIAFASYDIAKLLLRQKKIISKSDTGRVMEYFQNIRQYITYTFPEFLNPGIVDENDLIRLLHFIFVCDRKTIVDRCLDLNPTQFSGLIEEVSFYINMPHPFDPMPIRKRYKDSIIKFLELYNKMSLKNPVKNELLRFKNKFYSIKQNYESLELRSWLERYQNTKSSIDYILKHKKL